VVRNIFGIRADETLNDWSRLHDDKSIILLFNN
jgi:hypothetical protein